MTRNLTRAGTGWLAAIVLLAFTALSARAQSPDFLTNAITISPLASYSSGLTSITTNTSEVNEPSPLSTGAGHTIWFRIQPTVTGPVMFNTEGSSIKTSLAIYKTTSGAAISTLPPPPAGGPSNLNSTPVIYDFLSGQNGRSRLGVTLTSGLTYYIQVDSLVRTAPGNINLNYNPVVPANDAFASATGIFGVSGSIAGNNLNATKENLSNEPIIKANNGGASIWYKWTCPQDGIYQFSTAGSAINTLLGVFTGASVGSLTTIAQDVTGTSSSVSFPATSGKVYYVAVDGYNDGTTIAQGAISLGWSRLSALPTYTSGNAGTFALNYNKYLVSEEEGGISRSGTQHRSYRGVRTTVVRTGGTVGRVYVTVASFASSNAVAGVDFEAKTNVLTFDDFQMSADYIVPTVSARDGAQGDKAFTVQILNVALDPTDSVNTINPPTYGLLSQATVTLGDLDTGVNFGRANYRADENQSPLVISIERGTFQSDIANAIVVTWRIDNATLGPSTATDLALNTFNLQAGSDYGLPGVDITPTGGTVSFPVGDTSPKLISFTIVNDKVIKFNKDYQVDLLNVGGGAWTPGKCSSTFITLLQDKAADGIQVPGSVDRTYNPDMDGVAFAAASPFVSFVDKNSGVGPFDPSNFDTTTSPPYNTVPGANAMVAAVAVDTSGQAIIGGGFTTINTFDRRGLARMTAAGQLDTSFSPGSGIDGSIEAIALQTDGNIIVAGAFNSYNGSQRVGMARVLTTGAVDTTFDPGLGFDDTVWGVAIQTDGKIIAVGDFASAGGNSRGHIARLTTTGTLDSTFNTVVGADGPIYAVKLQPDGKIVIGGDFQNYAGVARSRIARLNTDGTLDTTFDPGTGANDVVWTVDVDSFGNVLAGGAFTSVNLLSRSKIVRLTSTGSVDTTFTPGTGFDDTVFVLKAQSGGSVLVGGQFSVYNSTRRIGLARVFTDGSLDTSFMDTAYNHFAGVTKPRYVDPNNAILAMDVQSDGNIIIGGDFIRLGGGFSRADIRSRYYFARIIGGSNTQITTPGNFQFVNSSYSGNESTNSGTINQSFVTITRVNGSLGAANVNFTRAAYPAGPGAATAGSDFNAGTDTLTWISTYGPLANTRYRADGYATPNNTSTTTTADDAYVNVVGTNIYIGDRTLDMNLQLPGQVQTTGLVLGNEPIPVGLALGSINDVPFTIVDGNVSHGTFMFSPTSYFINEGSNSVVLTVIRTNGSSGSASVQYTTIAPGGPLAGISAATPGVDYTSKNGTLTFLAGQTSKTITVPILDNTTVQPDRYFRVFLTNATGGAVLDTASSSSTNAYVQIVDDDLAYGHVAFASAATSVSESAGSVQLAVSRLGGSVGFVTASVTYSTAGLATPATAGADFNAASATTLLSWANGDSSTKFITVPLPCSTNRLVDGDRTFNVILGSFTGGLGAGSPLTNTVTIKDDDSPGTFSFNVSKYYANEQFGQASPNKAVLTIVRTGGNSGSVLLNITTNDIGATNGIDYSNLQSPSITFTDAQNSAQVTVDILPTGNTNTTNLTFSVTLTPVTVGALAGSIPTATVEIIESQNFNVSPGSLDTSFSSSSATDGPVYALKVQPDGRLLVGGDFTQLNGLSRANIGRLQQDGAYDSTFTPGTGPNAGVRALAVYTSGTLSNKIAVAGVFTNYAGTNRNYITRLSADGTIDSTFNAGSGANGPVYALGIDSSNQLLLGGSFTVFNGVSQPGVARLLTNGQRDTNFNTGAGPNGPIYALALQPDGKVLVGGDFTSFNGVTTSPYIVRLNSDGSVDTNFATGTALTGAVRAIGLQSSGNIVVGGSFVTTNGLTNIARLLASNGGLDPAFVTTVSANDSVFAVYIQEDDSILVAGAFTYIGSQIHNRIVRLLASTGAVDPTINFGAGADSFIAALAYQTSALQPGLTNEPDPKIVIGGDFANFDGTPKSRLARLHSGNLVGNGLFEYSSAVYSYSESAGQGTITIRRRGGTTGILAVTNNVFDVTNNIPNVGSTSATNGINYAFPTNQVLSGINYLNMTNQILTFQQGESVKVLQFQIADDQLVNADRLFFLQLSPTNVVGNQPQAYVNLVDDDYYFEFSAPFYSVSENVPGGMATITVMRRGNSSTASSVTYFTGPGTATPFLDYTPVTNTLTFAAGETYKSFQVPIIDDTIPELSETLTVNLTNFPTAQYPGAVTTATLTIIDNDSLPGTLSFDTANYTINEAAGSVGINVVRSNGIFGTVTVNVTTSDGTATNGIPPQGDYVATSVLLSFAPGETNKVVNVPITYDAAVTTNTTFFVTLSNPTGGSSLGTPSQTKVTIINNNILTAGNLQFTNAQFSADEDLANGTVYVGRFGSTNNLGTVSIDVMIVPGGTAQAGVNYSNVPVVLTNLVWAPGNTSVQAVNLPLISNNIVNGNKTVFLQLANPTNNGVADSSILGSTTNTVLTLLDNDFRAGVLTLSASNYQYLESAGTASINILRTNGSSGDVRVLFSTTNGSALSGVHYFYPSAGSNTGTNNITLSNGVSSVVASIILSNRSSLQEGDLTMTLGMSRPAVLINNSDTNAEFFIVATDPSIAFSSNGVGNITNVVVNFSTNAPSGVASYDAAGRVLTLNIDTNSTVISDVVASINTNAAVAAYFTAELPAGHVGSTVVAQMPTNTSLPVLSVPNSAGLTIQDGQQPAGSYDTSFATGTGANGAIHALAYRSDTKQVGVGGDFTTLAGLGRTNVGRFNTDGSLDSSYLPPAILQGSGFGTVNTLTTYTNGTNLGKVFVGGQFNSVNGQSRTNFIRLNADGTLDTTYGSSSGSGANAQIYASALQSDGKMLIGGAFTLVNGTNVSFVARLNLDGTLDTTFNAGLGANGTVRTLAVDADGTILIGGDFTLYNGTAFTNLVRLTTTGTVAGGFVSPTFTASGTNSSVRSVVIQPDGKILVGGYFDTVNGTNHANIARLTSTGLLDTGFDTGTGTSTAGTVNSIALQNDGKVLIGGDFLSFNGVAQGRVARLQSNGQLDPSFNAGTGADASVLAVALQSDSQILIAGAFTSVNGTPANRIARLNGGSNVGYGSFGFAATSYTFPENNGYAKFTITRTGGTSNQVDVVLNFSVSSPLLTAPASLSDFVAPATSNLVFAAGQTYMDISIPLVDNTVLTDGNRQVLLTLSSVDNGARLGVNTNAILTIQNDDGAVSFVSAQYSAYENQGVAAITVQRNYGLTGPASVTYTVRADTNTAAKAGVDFVAVTNVVSFATGQSNATFNVTLINNATVDPIRSVLLGLTTPVTGSVVLQGTTNASLSILDDETAPGVFSFSQASYTVQESGTNAVISIVRTNGHSGVVTLAYYTQDGTAAAGLKYTAVSNTVSFNDGETNKQVLIPIINNNIQDGDETFFVNLNVLTGGGSGGLTNTTVLIKDDDVAITFSSATYTANEGSGSVTIGINRNGLLTQTVVAQVSAVGFGPNPAQSGIDYIFTNQPVTFTNGVTSTNITIQLVDNTLIQGNRQLQLNLSSSGSQLAAGTTNAILTITDNDTNLDLQVLAGFVDPVFTNQTFTYTITATNAGPSTATGVVISNKLDANLTYLSSSNSTGAITVDSLNHAVLLDVGTLAPYSNALLYVTVQAPLSATNVTNIASITSTEIAASPLADSVPANNTNVLATRIRLAAPYFAADYPDTLLVADVNHNSAIDASETVTLQLALTNSGLSTSTNVLVALRTTGGITAASTNVVRYGAVAAGTAALPQPNGTYPASTFTFTAPSSGSSFTLSLHVYEAGGPDYDDVQFVFPLGVSQTGTNQDGTIVIPDSGLATPYPSVITVSNLSGIVSKVSVTLSNVTHSYPSDLGILLVSPTGQKVILMDNAGSGGVGKGLTNSTLTFDDAAASVIPLSGPVLSTSYRPTNYINQNSVNQGWPPVVAIGQTATVPSVLSAFNGINPNGVWSLYVADNAVGDAGTIGSWSVKITTVQPIIPTASLVLTSSHTPDPIRAGNTTVVSLVVSNMGPGTASAVMITNPVPAGTALISVTTPGSYSVSSGNIIINNGALAAGASVTNFITLQPMVAGTVTDTATVGSPENDLYSSDNTASTVITVQSSADLAMGVTPSTLSTVPGGTVVFTVLVTNLGPSAATNIIVTNLLTGPATIATNGTSQGVATQTVSSVTTAVGTLASNQVATVTVTTTATAAGTIVSTASVGSPTFDPNTANNSAVSQATVVSALADLAVTITNSPNPVNLSGTLIYTINVTNIGPSPATSVVVTNPLPNTVTFVSATNSQGSNSFSGNVVTFNVGTLAAGTNAVLQVKVTPNQSGTISASVGVTSAVTDPVASNNTNTIATTVISPAVDIVSAGVLLVNESGPVNGSVDPGETVTLQVSLRNKGTSDATNVTATLLAGGGVNSPTVSALNYGTLVSGGSSAAQSFIFTASGTNGGVINATFQITATGISPTLLTIPITMGAANQYANTNLITIVDNAQAAPYPSTVTVSNLTGTIIGARVQLNGLTHGYPRDIDMMLVAPNGTAVMILSHAGGGIAISNINLTLDNSATNYVPQSPSSAFTGGVYKPTTYGSAVMLAPAPTGSYYTNLSALNGVAPNGVWSLYVRDDAVQDAGTLASWSLQLITATPVSPTVNLVSGVTALPNPISLGGTLTYTLSVTNLGPNTASNVVITDVLPPGGASTFLSLTNPPGSTSSTSVPGVVSFGLTTLGAGSNATFQIQVAANTAGSITNTLSVGSTENNLSAAAYPLLTATTVQGAVLSVAPMNGNSLKVSFTGYTGYTYIVQVSTNLVSWTSIYTNVSTGGVINFTDTNMVGKEVRFYRAIQQ